MTSDSFQSDQQGAANDSFSSNSPATVAAPSSATTAEQDREQEMFAEWKKQQTAQQSVAEKVATDVPPNVSDPEEGLSEVQTLYNAVRDFIAHKFPEDVRTFENLFAHHS